MLRYLKIFFVILLIPVVIFVLLIVYASLSDYHPDKVEIIQHSDDAPDTISDSAVVNLLIWNIGYCGLDKKMDFFYDGGTGVRTTNEQLRLNLTGINQFLLANDTVDFILLQEVDLKSRRSYRVNEVEQLSEELGNNSSYYGKNYDVFFVPVPFNNPMGSVNSGLFSHTRFIPRAIERYPFPSQYDWPKRLFMLDRCFLVMRFPLSNGKELLVINTHNEAYDNGSIRDQQMAWLKDFLLSEYRLGNYMVVGGDWNQCPPAFRPCFNGEIFDTIDYKGIEKSYLPPEWTWVYENTVPSNRRLDIAYTKGKTRTTVIDFFLLSPNMRALGCYAIDLGFENSDHQPVIAKIALQ
jgi:endonuclease/exonuclease/phosphatase family metal-dependent hydrolase